MATSYTTLLGLALPVQGELSGTWGDTVNDYITQYLDAAVAGTQTISGSLTAVTLSKTTNASLSQAGTGATGSSQYQIINCTGNPGSLLTITAPAASKAYLVLNNTSTNQSVKVVGAGPTTGVTVAAARCALIAWNGSDFKLVASTDVAALQGLGTGVATALGVNVGTAGAFVVNGGALGTPSSGTVTNLTGTASININGTVGATTPTTGAFTTLTTSSTVTLNGGTANGVAYLNGSKALTTGSALVFDGTNFGIGRTPTNKKLEIAGQIWSQDATQPTAYFGNTLTDYAFVAYQVSSKIAEFGADGASTQLVLKTASVERMRITSAGNVGIATSSPTAPLDVNGNVAITGTGRRITGDFSNATEASRVSFQSSTTNGQTFVQTLPNGTSQFSGFQAWNNSTLTNAQFLSLSVDSQYAYVQSGAAGSGVLMPMLIGPLGGKGIYISQPGRVGVNTLLPGDEGAEAYLAVVGEAGQGASQTSASMNGKAVMTVRGNASSAFVLNVGSLSSDGTPYLQVTSSGGGVIANTLNLQTGGGNIRVGGNGTSTRITGDFSNATISSRVAFQTSTTNGGTAVGVLPNGTGATGQIDLHGGSDPANTSTLAVLSSVSLGEARFAAVQSGTGTYLPMTFHTGGSERVRINTSGNVGIGTSSPAGKLDIVGAVNNYALRVTDGTRTGGLIPSTSGGIALYTGDATALSFWTNDVQRALIDSSGNVGIGTSSPTAKLDVNADTVRVRTAKTPASATAAGNAGDICWDSSYVYVCVATNTWKRVAIATW